MASSTIQFNSPRLHWLFAAIAVVTILFSGFSPAEAQAQTVTVRVQVIHANHGGGVDSALGAVTSQLRSRFGHYSGFSLLGNYTVSVPNGGSQSISLPSGGSATISFQGMSGNAYRIGVNVPGGGTVVSSPPGGTFFVAGPGYGGGIIILYIST